MDIKEAKKIIGEPWIGGDDEDYGDYCLAKGFLEGVAATLELKEVKDLIRAINHEIACTACGFNECQKCYDCDTELVLEAFQKLKESLK